LISIQSCYRNWSYALATWLYLCMQYKAAIQLLDIIHVDRKSLQELKTICGKVSIVPVLSWQHNFNIMCFFLILLSNKHFCRYLAIPNTLV